MPDASIAYLEKPQAEYPRLARRRGEQGRVLLRVLIDAQGLPETVAIEESSRFDELDRAAIAAVRRARFRPYVKDGRAQPAIAVVPFTFRLEE